MDGEGKAHPINIPNVASANGCSSPALHKRNLSIRLRDFFSRKPKHPLPEPVQHSSSDSSGSDEQPRHPKPDAKQFEILQTQVKHIEHPEDVCFKQKYRFLNGHVIGRGASGVVRLACPLGNPEQIYAVKEFRKRRRHEPYHEYLRKMTSEYCIASMMHHGNVVRMIDIVHEDDRWYEVMEYCPGGDLFGSIHSGQQSREEVLCFYKQLVEGVEYLHKQGVCHRDLKPDNILIDNGRIKITDFGVSCVFHLEWERDCHKVRGLCGSSPYIAPEEYAEREYEGRAVDVWSLGIILYAMLFRAIPWEVARESDDHFLRYMETGKIACIEALDDRELNRLLYGMLTIDPLNRIQLETIKVTNWFQNICVCSGEGEANHSHEILSFDQ